MLSEFLRKIESRQARIGIVGLGYVGLPLLLEFVHAGFAVTGLDIDKAKVNQLNQGHSYIKHIPSNLISTANSSNRLEFSVDFSCAARCDALIICVPTPLTAHREPDMSYIVGTAKALSSHLKCGQLYSLESTTYPGTTTGVLIPILEEGSRLKAGKDFMVDFSPEREDPNNPEYSTRNIPKVVGAIDDASLKAASAMYGAIVNQVVPVSSTESAEATKLLENIFRSVNIAMVNELKIIFDKMNLDIWEIIEAAKTKPFGFMPFYPGPGLGGHCIPIDPFYLTWKAREFDVSTRFIELAGEVNRQMPYFVIDKLVAALNTQGKALKGAKILILGLAYKKNVDDDRESPSYKLWRILEQRGAVVAYSDPYCPAVVKNRAYPEYAEIKSTPLSEIETFDAVLVSTAHDSIDYVDIMHRAKLIVDTRHALPDAPNVFRA